MCVRYAYENLDAEEVFSGMYNTPDSTANTLYRVIKDVAI